MTMIIDSVPPPPNHFLKEELAARSWTQTDLAYVLGRHVSTVNIIISGKRGISPEMSKALGEALGVKAELFTNLQTAFDLSKARDPDPGISRRARLLSVLPIREMIRRGWLRDSDPETLEAQVVRFFEVDKLEDVFEMVNSHPPTGAIAPASTPRPAS
jgi:HTH-type transcriptional regulator/antitoxin HigA